MKNIFTFLAVVTHKSFTKASQNLHITQPAITKRIANLEEQFKIKLFDRIGHNVLLTDAGKAFYPYALSIQTQWHNAKHKIDKFSTTVKGTLVIACNYHVGTNHLPQLIKTYKKKFPDVDYDFVFRSSNEVIELVLDHQVELGFLSCPKEINDDLFVKNFWQNDMRVILSRNHNFFKQKGEFIKNLSNIPLLLPEKLNIYHTILNNLCEDYNIKSKNIPNINMLDTIKKMVEAGIGWSIYPKHLIDEQLCEVAFIKKDTMQIYHVFITKKENYLNQLQK